MHDSGPGDATRMLSALSAGEAVVEEQLLRLIYDELRAMARRRLALEGPAVQMQTSSLVHEVYLRLMAGSDQDLSWQCRAHFFGAAAEAMRRILVEQARHRKALKHGGGRRHVSIDVVELADTTPKTDLIALHEALERLESHDQRMATVVKLRYFAGLTIEQTAEVLNVTTRTVDRDWQACRVWLYRELHGPPAPAREEEGNR